MSSRAPWLLLATILLACDEPPEEEQPDNPEICTQPDPTSFVAGATMGDLFFRDCNNGLWGVRSLCGSSLTLINNFYAWCPSCPRLLDACVDWHSEYADDGLVTLVVVSDNLFGETADVEYCQMVQDYVGEDVLVAFDPEKKLESYGTTGLVLLMQSDGTLLFARRGAPGSSIRAAIEAGLP